MTTGNPTRGIRNNNPGNIRLGQQWQGLSPQQTDPEFCQFIDMAHGVRAIAVIIRNYQKPPPTWPGLKTVRQIISRWAPPADHNDTDAYISHVASLLGVQPDAPIDATDKTVMQVLVRAIVTQENGRDAGSSVTDADILNGVSMP